MNSNDIEMTTMIDGLEHDSSRIGQALNLKESDIERIVAMQKQKNILFGQAACELGLVSQADLQKVLSEQFGYNYALDNNRDLSKLLITAYEPFSPIVEGIRSLRGQLLIRWFNEVNNKTLAITSTTTDDEASVLAANLAIAFSQLNKKTLLIDANLRRPNQQKLFGIKTNLGVANILANRQGRYELAPLKYLPNLTVLHAGTEAPNPQELLTRESMSTLLADLEKMYDVILIDTSPADLGVDYLSIVTKAKAALVVARKNETLMSNLASLKSEIEVTSAQIIGSVIQ